MKTRDLGKTGIRVSEFILGGGYVGGILLQPDEEEKLAAVQHGLNCGINMIDTAPSYGNGESEKSVGRMLPHLTSSPYLATKVQIHSTNREDLTGQIEKSLHESLTRLSISSVDLLQLHNPLNTTNDHNHLAVEHLFEKNGVIKALQKVKDEGMAKHIGMTALGDTSACTKALETGAFDTAQIYYNLINPTADQKPPNNWRQHDFWNLMAICQKLDIGIMNIRVFAAGILASTERTGREIAVTGNREFDFSEDEYRANKIFENLPDDGYTSAQQALRFSLTNPKISCIVLGLANMKQMEEALAVATAPPMSSSALDILERLYENNFYSGA